MSSDGAGQDPLVQLDILFSAQAMQLPKSFKFVQQILSTHTNHDMMQN